MAILCNYCLSVILTPQELNRKQTNTASFLVAVCEFPLLRKDLLIICTNLPGACVFLHQAPDLCALPKNINS